MDQKDKELEPQKPEPEKRPTPGELFQAWKDGGEAKLAEMLPDEPDGEEE